LHLKTPFLHLHWAVEIQSDYRLRPRNGRFSKCALIAFGAVIVRRNLPVLLAFRQVSLNQDTLNEEAFDRAIWPCGSDLF